MEESKVSMMKRKSIEEAMNKGECLPAAAERSETGSNKHNLGYQVELIRLTGNKKKKLIKSIYVGFNAYRLEETIARYDY